MNRVTIRPFEKHEWALYRDLRLRALSDAPDAFGSTYREARRRPDAAWISYLDFDPMFERPLVAAVDRCPAGLVWGHIDADHPDTAHVFQMWVAPEFRKQRLGAMLLDDVIGWATQYAVERVVLSVTCANSAARRLYERAGFLPDGEPEPLRPESDLCVQPMALVLGSLIRE